MFSQTIMRPKLQTAVLKWFVSEEFSFEQETALANCAAAFAQTPNGGLLDVGIVLGKITQGAGAVAAAVAGAANVGNGLVALAGMPFLAGGQAGIYEAIAVTPLEWEVYDPSGKLVGIARDTVAFANQIAFTITHGATAFAAGDIFTFAVTIAAGSGKVVPLNPAATDGSQYAIGVGIRQTMVPAAADAQIVVVERLAVLLADGLIWPAGITAQQQAAAIAQLTASDIIVRSS
jgi:hypothetical protein